MTIRRKIVLFLRALFWVLASFLALSQTQTTGRLVGTVADTQGAAIVGAEVVVENSATSDKRTTTSDRNGSFSLPSLSPANYDLRIEARGFSPAMFHNIAVGLSETRTVNAILQVAKTSFEVNVSDAPPLLRSDNGSQPCETF